MCADRCGALIRTRLGMAHDIDTRDIFLKGKDVILKVLTRDDATGSGWYGWFNDEVLCKTLQKHYFPTTMESQVAFWEQNVKNAIDRIQLGICRLEGGPIVGIISLSHIDFINRTAEMSIVIGDRKAQNLSIFVDSCRLIFNHAFYTLNLNRIYGGSISQELVTILCRLLNCKSEGTLRQDVFKNGKYHDSYRYAVLRDEFPPLSMEDWT
jgi:ribosomal-protein-alanine N-acetyltransferase